MRLIQVLAGLLVAPSLLIIVEKLLVWAVPVVLVNMPLPLVDQALLVPMVAPL
jgi:hypothetical protein